eukprot:11203871-Heterocapsa_arctica.AAC.1
MGKLPEVREIMGKLPGVKEITLKLPGVRELCFLGVGFLVYRSTLGESASGTVGRRVVQGYFSIISTPAPRR